MLNLRRRRSRIRTMAYAGGRTGPPRRPRRVLGARTAAFHWVEGHRNFRDLPDHFDILRIRVYLRLTLRSWMGLQNQALPSQATPSAGIAGPKLQEVDGPVEFIIPSSVDDAPAGVVDNDQGAWRDEGRHE